MSLLNNLPSYSSESFRQLEHAQLPLPPPPPPKRYTANANVQQHVKTQPVKREKMSCLIRALASKSAAQKSRVSTSDGQNRACKRARLHRPSSNASLDF